MSHQQPTHLASWGRNILILNRGLGLSIASTGEKTVPVYKEIILPYSFLLIGIKDSHKAL